jgi:hypothetical protein
MKTFIFFFLLSGSLLINCQSTWSTPINIGTSYQISNPSLETVNGFPAICYRNDGEDIMFKRALDACGDTWGTAINVSGAYIPNINSKSSPDMIIVDGHPAICFQDDNHSTFVYCRADDQDGTSWTQFKIIDSGGVIGRKCEMVIVNGNPAIVYNHEEDFCGGSIKYVRATDIQGNGWNLPTVLVGGQCIYGYINIVNIQILNGNPAVSMNQRPSAGSGNPRGIYFIRSLDVDGLDWLVPELVYPEAASLGFTVVDNKPHILVTLSDFSNPTNDSLAIAVSSDTLGSIWPATLDTIDFGPSSTYYGRITKFDNTVWVTGIHRDNYDTLSLVSAPSSMPLTFGPKEIIRANVGFNTPHDFNTVCGQLAAVYRYTDFYYTRTETMITYYLDSDTDDFGDPNISMTAISPPAGYVTDDTDCDDSDPLITQPGAPCDDGNVCTSGTTLQPDCSCGNPTVVNSTINTFIGTNDLWMDASNWSLNVIPEICHDIIIPANKSVRLLAGELGICFTLDVHVTSTMETDPGGLLHVFTLGY